MPQSEVTSQLASSVVGPVEENVPPLSAERELDVSVERELDSFIGPVFLSPSIDGELDSSIGSVEEDFPPVSGEATTELSSCHLRLATKRKEMATIDHSEDCPPKKRISTIPNSNSIAPRRRNPRKRKLPKVKNPPPKWNEEGKEE